MDLVELNTNMFAEIIIAARHTIGVGKRRHIVAMVARQILDIVVHLVIVIIDIDIGVLMVEDISLALVEIHKAAKERKVAMKVAMKVVMKVVMKVAKKVVTKEGMALSLNGRANLKKFTKYSRLQEISIFL
jgi:hypothetical protein